MYSNDIKIINSDRQPVFGIQTESVAWNQSLPLMRRTELIRWKTSGVDANQDDDDDDEAVFLTFRRQWRRFERMHKVHSLDSIYPFVFHWAARVCVCVACTHMC